MYQEKKIWIGKSGDEKVYIRLPMANRHGLIAGATGTGKTTTLRVLAESFSDCGVPVFLADIKGDVAAMCKAGAQEGFVASQMESMNLPAEGFELHECPVTFWDVYGEKGLPLRTTVSEMGPLLLSRILGLNETQSEVLTVVFRIADDEGLLLIDSKDLRSMLQHVGENAKEYSLKYGNMSSASLTTIIRSVIALEDAGGDKFLGEPALKITDWITKNEEGAGMINILDCQKLAQSPTMYSTFMLWMLSELYETLPEVGDMGKPRIVFFFDEAHMLFDNAPKTLLDKIEQVVKLIRSKGVGIYFITQYPKDIPDGVLSQLGNKIQHALHAYTPSDQKLVKAAAMSFRENPEFNTYEAIQNLAIGEALVSVLDDSGVPTVSQLAKILPPQCGMGPIDDSERDQIIKQNDLYFKYSESVDRDSAYEFLERKHLADQEAAQKAEEEKQKAKEEAAAEKQRLKEEAAAEKQKQKEEAAAQKAQEKAEAAAQKEAEKKAAATKNKVNKVVKSVASTTGGTIGRELGNTLGSSIGGSFGKKLGGNVGASLGRGILGSLFSK